MFDFGEEGEDDHVRGNMIEHYGKGAWELREGRQFNRVSPPLQDDDEYGRRGLLRHEDDEDAEESEKISDDEHGRRVLHASRQIRKGGGDTTGFKKLQSEMLRRSQRAQGLGLGRRRMEVMDSDQRWVILLRLCLNLSRKELDLELHKVSSQVLYSANQVGLALIL